MGTLDPWINSSTGDGYRNSVVALPGDGSKTTFDFNFGGGYIDKSHIKAYTYDTSNGHTQPVPFTWAGPNTIRVVPAPATGIHVVIYRDTPKSQPLVDFSTNASMTEKNLDLMAQQAIFAAAEMVDRFDSINAGSSEAIERSVTALNTANTALSNSNAATATANSAATSATAAVGTANTASADATNALNTANGIDAKATTALNSSASAVTTADSASATANGIDAKAQQALDTANVAAANADGRKDGTLVSFDHLDGNRVRNGLTLNAGHRTAPGDLQWALIGDVNDTFAIMSYAAGSVFNYAPFRAYLTGNVVVMSNAPSAATLDVSSHRIVNLASPTGTQDATTKGYTDTQDSQRVAKTGDTMAGGLYVNETYGMSELHGGSIEVYSSSGPYIDFKRNSGDDFNFRIQQNSAGTLRVGHSGGAYVEFPSDGNIYTSKGGWYLVDKMNTKTTGDTCSDVGFVGGSVRRPYMRNTGDNSVRTLVVNNSANGVEIGWQGSRLRAYVDGIDQGDVWTSAAASNLDRSFYSGDGARIGRSWLPGNGFLSITVDGTGYGITINPSDARLKQDIAPSATDALLKLKQIKLYSFRFRDGNIMDPSRTHEIGFIAQQLQQVDPTFTLGDAGMMLSPAQLPILATAVKAIQELSAQVGQLQAEVAALRT
ncbi:phage tail fiber protein [Ralstonia pseudosolanacearum]|uniref:phage tail fiber domain-containing protein n=1 Tax=Ralstonia pseudosolanacearum TaxID=1310165 RepID=UPI000B92EDCD|nr:phage tail fiber protein [Ralstonia pseudosolanacearum]MCD9228594.1 tail fiber domain-containing protein [Ralstonia pseudosolanacearum]